MRTSARAPRPLTRVGIALLVGAAIAGMAIPGCSDTCGGCCNDQDCDTPRRVCTANRCADAVPVSGVNGRDGSNGKDGTSAPPDSVGEYIVGGEITRAFAATGALLQYGRPMCTATLVAPDKVLTAAHCVVGASVQALSFAVGTNPGSNSTAVRVVAAATHPQYVSNGQRPVAFDLAVLSLSGTVSEIRPAAISGASATAFSGAMMTLVGYGADADGSSGLGIRKLARVSIQTVSSQTLDYLSPGMGACKGDSGGPAFVANAGGMVQIGVTSWGAVPCTGEGHYQRIDVALGWLQSQGVTVDAPPTACGEDRVCQGGCDNDKDCWPIMCPEGNCSVPSGRCVKNGTCEAQCGTADPDCSGFVDTCAEYGLYGNGRCDPNCPSRDPDCNQQTPQLGGFCCDGYAFRRCVLGAPAPVGSNCFCPGQGYGYTCL